MNDTCFDFVQPVRFSADVVDSFGAYVPPAQQPKSLLSAGLSLRIHALRTEMEFVFAQDFALGLYACNAATAMEASRRNLILFSGVLIDPGQINPALGIRNVGRYQMKLFRINVGWKPKRFHMARQQEVEWCYAIAVLLATIEPCQ